MLSMIEAALASGKIGKPSGLAKFGSAAKDYLSGTAKDIYDPRRWTQQGREDELEKEKQKRRMSVLYDSFQGPY